MAAGLFFAIPQFLVSNLHGPWLVDVIASVSSMAAVTRPRSHNNATISPYTRTGRPPAARCRRFCCPTS